MDNLDTVPCDIMGMPGLPEDYVEVISEDEEFEPLDGVPLEASDQALQASAADGPHSSGNQVEADALMSGACAPGALPDAAYIASTSADGPIEPEHAGGPADGFVDSQSAGQDDNNSEGSFDVAKYEARNP